MCNPLGDWFQGWMWPEHATNERMSAAIRPETCDCPGHDHDLLGMAAGTAEFGTCRSSRRARPCRPACTLVSATGSGGAAVSGFSFPTGTDRARSHIPEHCSKPRRTTFQVLLHQAVAAIRATVGSGTGELTRRLRAGYAAGMDLLTLCRHDGAHACSACE
jgi:hypothetical protein